MTKSELILVVSKHFPHLTGSDVKLSVNTILNGMTNHLANSGRIELRGFGSFKVYVRPARISRNPKTGEKVHVEAKRRPHFKSGIELRNRVNDVELHSK